ncbi:MAG TPA: hypothetical protein VK028_02035 [Micromonosporaceae bacterium]|nr:hypothetical protein [Micromonosporaceae bacterium]
MAPVTPPSPTSAPNRPPRMRRWVVVATTVWGLLLAGGVVWSVYRGEPTAREQTTITDADPVTRRAVAELARASTVDRLAVVALQAGELSECEVSLARDGLRLQVPMLAFVAAGTEEALLQRIAERLPDSYQAKVRTGDNPRLTADAGLWVAIIGTVIAPGQVRLVVDTGDCRPAGSDPVALPMETVADRATAQAVLDALSVPPQEWRSRRIACADGGVLETVSVTTAEDAAVGPLDRALSPVTGSGTVVATRDLVAYFSGDTGVAVRIDGTRLVVTSTDVRCGA